MDPSGGNLKAIVLFARVGLFFHVVLLLVA
jgi:hypothetical protein